MPSSLSASARVLLPIFAFTYLYYYIPNRPVLQPQYIVLYDHISLMTSLLSSRYFAPDITVIIAVTQMSD